MVWIISAFIATIYSWTCIEPAYVVIYIRIVRQFVCSIHTVDRISNRSIPCPKQRPVDRHLLFWARFDANAALFQTGRCCVGGNWPKSTKLWIVCDDACIIIIVVRRWDLQVCYVNDLTGHLCNNSTFHVLLDLLFKSKRHQKVLRVYEIIATLLRKGGRCVPGYVAKIG